MHDLHAAQLRQLGLNHEHLTWRHYDGPECSLTDVHGRVVKGLLA